MRWLTPIILIVVLLNAACGHDPGGKDKIAVIDWDKAFSAHPKQTVLKQGEAELQKLLRYREEQAEIAKTQIAGLTKTVKLILWMPGFRHKCMLLKQKNGKNF